MQMKSLARKAGQAVGGIAGIGIGMGMPIISTVSDYKRFKEEGNSPLVAGIKSAGTFIFYDMLGSGAFFYQGAQMAYTFARQAGDAEMQAYERGYERTGRFGAGFVPTTQAGYTMRQRSINAIRQNGLNVDSVFGNEARQYFGRS